MQLKQTRRFGTLALLVLTTLHLPFITAHAQSTSFTYQGRVTDNGSNFTGMGQFKFALVTPINTSQQAGAVLGNIYGGLDNWYFTSVNVYFGGSGYVTPPLVTIPGATATATISGGVVTAISTSGGGPYNMLPSVIIDPPPANIVNATLWSNDGTTSGQPAAAVSVGVTNGLFTLVLGDTTVSNMTAIPASLFSQFSYPNLLLQIWFNDGVHGFAALNPPQALTPAPAAVFANTASNLLGTLPTSQLTGTVPATSLSGSVPAASLTSVPAASLTGSVPAASLTSVPAGSLTGTIAQAELGTTNAYSPTIGDGTYGFTTSRNNGYYAKVGNLIYFSIWLQWTGKGSAVAGNTLQISLPVPPVTPRSAFTLGFLSGVSFTTELKAGTAGGNSYFTLFNISNSGGAGTVLPVSSCSSSGELQVSGVYPWQ